MTKKDLIHYGIIILVVLLIRTFIVTPIRVNQLSMYPTLREKDILLLKKYDKSYKRFDIVVFKIKKNLLIKRIIGLPKETIEYKNNKLYINEEIIEENLETEDFDKLYISENCYFVMGDNRENSVDSRSFGEICKKDMKGKTNTVIFPFKSFGKVK